MINTDGVRCMLFDLDGTLIDSMAYWRALTVHQARLRYGHLAGYTEELETKITVLPYAQARSLLAETFSIPIESVKTDREYTRGMMRLFYRDHIGEKKEACRILRDAHARGIKTALLTATRQSVMGEALTRLDLLPHLDLILTPDDYPSGKWTEDIFLGALSHFGVKPEETLFFEDSLYSIELAHRLGIRTVGVEDHLNRFDRDRIREITEDFVCLGESLREVDPAVFAACEKEFGRTACVL